MVRADKHIVISVRPPRCRKVPLKCKCVFVHVRDFVLSACASVFIAIYLKTSHRGLFLSSGSLRCCCLTTVLFFPEGVIQSFLLSLTTVLNCPRQWLYNCHFVVLILILKQVWVTTGMKAEELATCCISLKHFVTTGQVWTGREECC